VQAVAVRASVAAISSEVFMRRSSWGDVS